MKWFNKTHPSLCSRVGGYYKDIKSFTSSQRSPLIPASKEIDDAGGCRILGCDIEAIQEHTIDKQVLKKLIQNMLLTDYREGSTKGEAWFLNRLKESTGITYEDLEEQ